MLPHLVLHLGALGAALLALPRAAAQVSPGWNFTWPATTQQCQNATVSITGGTPPWIVGLVPIGGVPIVWRVDQDARGAPNATNPITASIPIQLPGGTYYTVVLADSIGYAGESRNVMNPSPLQIVRPSTDASCLASVRSEPQEFTFSAFGGTSMCTNGFTLGWNDRVGRSPYSMTVVPLDTSYHPWDVALSGGVIQPGVGWQVNMTVGTRFTVIMSNDNGWGRGGVGQIYEVTAGSTNSCIVQTNQGRVELPPLATASPLQPGASYTTTINPESRPPSSSTVYNVPSKGLTSGVVSESAPARSDTSDSGSNGGGNKSTATPVGLIAGAAAGGAVALAIIAGLVWFFLRRKRQRARANGYGAHVDLNGGGAPPGGAGMVEHKIEPFRNHSAPGVPTMGYIAGGRANAGLSPNTPYAPYDAVSPGGSTNGMGTYDPHAHTDPVSFPVAVPHGSPAQDPRSPSQTSSSGITPYGMHHGEGSTSGSSSDPSNSNMGGYGNPNVNRTSSIAVALKSASPPTFTSPRYDVPTGLAVPAAVAPSMLGSGSESGAGAGIGGGVEMAHTPGAESSVGLLAPSVPGSPGSPGSPGTPSVSVSPLAQAGQALAAAAPASVGSMAPRSAGEMDPHEDFEFVRHRDGGAVVDLPPDYNDLPRRD